MAGDDITPDRRRRRFWVGRDLQNAARGQDRCDTIPNAPQRVADVALRKLIALVVAVRAGGHGQGAVNGFDDGRH